MRLFDHNVLEKVSRGIQVGFPKRKQDNVYGGQSSGAPMLIFNAGLNTAGFGNRRNFKCYLAADGNARAVWDAVNFDFSHE